MENKPPQIETVLRPVRMDDPPRLKKIRHFAWLLDQSVGLPGGFRIGVDPILGVIPGFGDIIAATLSCYLIYQGARLGMPKKVLMRMGANVLIEALVGEFPILGDIFDAVWKANTRNFNLIEKHYHRELKERSAGKVITSVGLIILSIWLISISLSVLVIFSLISILFP